MNTGPTADEAPDKSSPGKSARGEQPGKQAAKSRRTKDKILAAVKELIDEGGFSAASSTRIARAAGVSWGVVQHHFGDKPGILLAVLEQCSEEYIAFMSAIPRSSGSRPERIRAYVARCWEFYCGQEYKIALEIALAMRFDNSLQGTPEVFRLQQRQLIDLWRAVFPDTRVDDAILEHLIRHTYIVLTGLVIDAMLESETRNTQVQLQMLACTLESYLYGKGVQGLSSASTVHQ